MENIYISKPGVFCAAGKNIDELWQSVTTKNQKGIKKHKICTGDEFYAARVDDSALKPAEYARYDMKIIRLEEAALNQIAGDIEAAKKRFGAERVAVCAGSCDNGTEFSLAAHRKFLAEGKFPQDYKLEMQGADYVATYISERFELKGPSLAFATACSSSGSAVIKAAELILSGFADAVVTGGVDIASDTALAGFSSLEAISTEITNPFSKNRHGITMGDAAAFFLLSKDSTVFSSDSTTVRLLGFGESADAYHATSPNPDGQGAVCAIKAALERAGLKASQIDYLNLHGTGTKLNDSMESLAVAQVFGSGKKSVPASSTKPVTGHTLGAAAALELSICYKTLIENFDENCNNILLPLQIWDGRKDPELAELNFADKNGTASGKIKTCMSNSFAFGGANVSLIIGF